MAEEKKLSMKERWGQDKGVAFWNSKLKKWVAFSDGDDNGKQVDDPQNKNIDEIDEIER